LDFQVWLTIRQRTQVLEQWPALAQRAATF
jgi:hypothetical protein